MNRVLTACLAGLAAAFLPACGMLDAQLETRTVCFTRTGYPIPGATGSGSIESDVVIDAGSELPSLAHPVQSYSLALQGLELAVAAGTTSTDLGWVDGVDVWIRAPSGRNLPEPALARYEKGTDPRPRSIEATSTNGLDLVPYLDHGRLTFHVLASGAPPRQAWAADVRACFLLTVNVDYGKAM